jgi:lipoprotein signal peptidase
MCGNRMRSRASSSAGSADAEFGLGFIKLCTYFSYPGKVWANRHEWAKRQAAAEGLVFTELANGFASCTDPVHLQAICDRLGPAHLQAFFDRWIAVIPTPLNDADRQAGYWWELSMRQVETSRTLVFDAPRRARAFFEALVADNLDLGRPDEVQLIFGRHIRSNTDSPFSTKVVTRGVQAHSLRGCLPPPHQDWPHHARAAFGCRLWVFGDRVALVRLDTLRTDGCLDLMLVELIAAGGMLLFLDQWSKRMVEVHLGNACASCGPFLRIRRASHVYAGLRSNATRLLLVLVWLAALVCAIILHRSGAWFRTDTALVGVAVAFGGSAGNLLDMLRRGSVANFIDLGWWPVFNIADVAIVTGLFVAFWPQS